MSPAPVLAIDAGNTRIKWGLHNGAGWNARGACPTAEADAVDARWPAFPAGTKAIVSNVAGPEVAARLRAACGRRGLEATFIRSRASQLGVRSGYRDPEALGTDRWAALIAAHARGGGDKLVVNAGTALTIDALAADGQFLGGIIVPGPALMRRSLNRGTADLRATEGVHDPFPGSPPDAITTGSIIACVGAIAAMGASMRERGLAPDSIVLSGGAAEDIARHYPSTVVVDDNLVLDGLVRIARSA